MKITNVIHAYKSKFPNKNLLFKKHWLVYRGDQIFNSFQRNRKIFLHLVFLCVHALTFVNISEIILNFMFYLYLLQNRPHRKWYTLVQQSVYEDRQQFYDTLQPGGKYLKHILTHLYCTKCSENNICHLGIQKYVS